MNEITFEEAIAELEKYTKSLETGNISLDESISIYQKAIELSKRCNKLLDNAKQKIEIIDSEYNEENLNFISDTEN